MNATLPDNAWQEMQRLRDLGEEAGIDPLQLAVEELARYKSAIRETRLERDRLGA
jgi:hypothetical protein